MNFAQILAGVARGNHNMQQNAQANVPVIPNNGNPGGAFNMPQNPTLPAQAAPVAPVAAPQPAVPAAPPMQQNKYFYPWMNPSPAMQQVYQMLGQRGGMRAQTMMDEQPQMDPLRREMILPQRR